MGIAYSQYRSALAALDHIQNIKTEMESLLYARTRLLYGGIPLGNAEYFHAVQCINEIIDDLFRQHLAQSHIVIGKWQRQE